MLTFGRPLDILNRGYLCSDEPAGDPTGGTGGGVGAATPPAAPPAAPPAPVVDVKAAEKAAAKAAEKALLDALGVSKVEDAKAVLDAAKAAEDAKKDAEQKAREEADTAKAAQAAAEARVKQVEFAANLDRFLVACNVTGANLEDAATLVAAKVTPESTPDDVIAAVASLRDRQPHLFAAPAANGTPAPSGVPAGGGKPPAGGTGTKTGLDAGAERAAKVREERKQTQPETPFGGFRVVGAA